MVNKSRAPLYLVSNCRPFLDLLGQMEELCRATDLVWHPDVADDVRLRLKRLERGLRAGSQLRAGM
jgi:hypothetical protein